jgi:CBS domain-containing protein
MRIATLNSVISARLALIETDATVRTAASFLSARHLGLLVVCDKDRKAAGVVSKSDLIRHLTHAGVVEAPVATLMSRNIVSCGPGDDLYATWQRMAARSLQNLPVLGSDSRPLGVLDIRDALKALLEEEEYQELLLRNYVVGIGYQ